MHLQEKNEIFSAFSRVQEPIRGQTDQVPCTRYILVQMMRVTMYVYLHVLGTYNSTVIWKRVFRLPVLRR